MWKPNTKIDRKNAKHFAEHLPQETATFVYEDLEKCPGASAWVRVLASEQHRLPAQVEDPYDLADAPGVMDLVVCPTGDHPHPIGMLRQPGPGRMYGIAPRPPPPDPEVIIDEPVIEAGDPPPVE